jgi:uncharacterized protein YjbJ (UPF0337 family)
MITSAIAAAGAASARATKKHPTGDYEVGYCRPPVHTQYEKGKSGNPKGRTKCSVVGTLPASSRCLDEKEQRGPSRACHDQRIATMHDDRISGTARNVGGKIEEGVGRLTGDAKTQIQGKLDQAAGAAQDLYGQTTDAARDTAATFDKWLRNTVETQPYTVAIAALGIGWLLGRMHRPL